MATATGWIIGIAVIIWIPVLIFRAARATAQTTRHVYHRANPAARARYERKMSAPRHRNFPLPGSRAREETRAAANGTAGQPGSPEWRAIHVPGSAEYRAARRDSR